MESHDAIFHTGHEILARGAFADIQQLVERFFLLFQVLDPRLRIDDFLRLVLGFHLVSIRDAERLQILHELPELTDWHAHRERRESALG